MSYEDPHMDALLDGTTDQGSLDERVRNMQLNGTLPGPLISNSTAPSVGSAASAAPTATTAPGISPTVTLTLTELKALLAKSPVSNHPVRSDTCIQQRATEPLKESDLPHA
jgi:hypothetical protein